MNAARKVACLMALVTPLVLTGAASAQDQLAAADDQVLAQAAQSWAMQAGLAEIDGNKEAFVNSLLESWVPFVDRNIYDLWSEIKPIAMNATAWQLYGASRVGDFATMVAILRGRIGAGRYVDALYQPTARTMVVPQNIGDTTADLVFTPIPPCRIVDTRGSGARTGILVANSTRVFDLTTNAYAKGQGGATSGCTGLPSFSHFGWALNITVAGYAGDGGLKVYPSGGAEPATSAINYFAAAYAIANGSNPAGCYGCADDITVKAFGADTHVIIDVMGYFEVAQNLDATTTLLAGTSTAIATTGFVSGGACPAGTQLVGTEADWLGGTNVLVGEIRRASATTARVWAVNQDGSSQNIIVYSMCQDAVIAR